MLSIMMTQSCPTSTAGGYSICICNWQLAPLAINRNEISANMVSGIDDTMTIGDVTRLYIRVTRPFAPSL